MRNSISIEKIAELPNTTGVYFLKNRRGEIFYVGKAINIKNRIQSHKNEKRLLAREKIETIEWIQTANEIEALLKESEFIKKLQPKMNIRLRDDKKYFYVGFTNEMFPRVFITHQPNYQPDDKNQKRKIGNNTEYIGPFTDGGALRATMRYLRKIFPYYSTNEKRPYSGKLHGALPCSWCHIEMCPGPHAKVNTKKYKKNILAIKRILRGQKNTVTKHILSEMKHAAHDRRYEKAAKARDLIESIENIFAHHNTAFPWRSIGDIKKPSYQENAEYISKMVGAKLPVYSIEGYDISNIQGKEATASMVRFEHGQPEKSLYRKFTIYTHSEPDDYKMMREVIKRRLKHTEWPAPNLMLIDGGRGQLNAALEELKSQKLNICVVSLAKKEEELYLPGKKPKPTKNMPPETANLLLYVRDEAHRFALAHHKKLRMKKVLK